MPGLSHSRSDKVICSSFLTWESMKFVQWVNRFKRCLPSNSFEGHHYTLYFSTPGVSASQTGLTSAVSSAGVPSTALIFCILYHLLFPSCGRFEAQWWCFGHSSCSLSLSPTGCTNFGLILGKKSYRILSALFLHCSRNQGLVLQCPTEGSLSLEVQQSVITEPTNHSTGQESLCALPAALCCRHWTTKLMLCEI